MSRDEEFTAYVRERRAHLFRAAYLLCGDEHRAEDIVQLTLSKVYSAWRKVRKADSVDAYVRRVLVNSHLDEGRRPWRRERSGEVADHPVPTGLGAEEVDELWTALRSLPAGQRRVVVLRHYWGLSVEETAADLGISGGTVKSQTSAALANLRRTLRPGLAAPDAARGGRR
ncbi:SigE family RNA polymerase sigma factor [Nocardioides albus]|uniref:RNA polymerase sigma-70 factor (Sigma-E family) n=1 Tax=Nocardioides albus TaxID=1841 RepID=A0A7W5F705_9ACTN|nr:SigE family RNA polymerase sigma factor [Nocardioides albus]MBB3087491.1 RNA polymerase sigma-70 factor (sigma-E family) [Nocardioides albus]GGU09379.1 DNA-directed RNA polymerase sigma-70 factor [Nocardioides albus]